jgi:hypothetical protein
MANSLHTEFATIFMVVDLLIHCPDLLSPGPDPTLEQAVAIAQPSILTW